jgi:hypothetical protein
VVVLTATLVVNAGSSSLKLRVLDDAGSVVGSADLPPQRGADDTAPVKAAIGPFGDVYAVGHRIVHGGAASGGCATGEVPARPRPSQPPGREPVARRRTTGDGG